MARARLLKPGFFANEELAQIEPLGRLLWQGMWCLADREGRLEDRPLKIKGQALPFDSCDPERLVTDLAERGFLIRYEVDGTRYLQIVNFTVHQTPHYKEIASVIPPPPAALVEAASNQRRSNVGPTSADDDATLKGPRSSLLVTRKLDPESGGEPDGETHPAPARETPPPAAVASSETTDATDGRPASPHAAADALIDAMVEGLRDAKKIGTLTTKTTAGLRRRERPTAQRLVRDGWSPPDIRACTRFLASIYATVDMLLVERQIDTWEVNGRPESKAAAMPARAAPAAPLVKPNGTMAAIYGGLAAHGEHADDHGGISDRDGELVPDLATPGARSGHSQGAQRYLPPGAGRPDG